MSIKTEPCPHCGTIGSLYICSFAAVSCSECWSFVRKANDDERGEAFKKFSALGEYFKREKNVKNGQTQ